MEEADLLRLMEEVMLEADEEESDATSEEEERAWDVMARIETARGRNIKGIEVLERKVKAEIAFLESELTTGEACSNMGYFNAVLDVVEAVQGETFVGQKHRYKAGTVSTGNDIDMRQRKDTWISDVVCQRGLVWIKVKATMPKESSLALPSHSKSLFDVARNMVEAASQNQIHYRAPACIMYFAAGDPSPVRVTLESMGVHVIAGQERERLTAMTEPKVGQEYCTSSVNLDVSSMIALCSELTNTPVVQGTTYPTRVMEEQAVREREDPILKMLHPILEGKSFVVTESALQRFKSIVGTIAGPNEKKRAEALIASCTLVPDSPSNRCEQYASNTQLSTRQKANLAVFGTADRLRLTTLTSNESYVRSMSVAGIEFAVLLHSARALIEQKTCI